MCGMSPWMRMPGQSWLDAEASFLAMWVAMMAAMMLPSLLPVLLRYRPDRAVTFAAGYLAVWSMIGAVLFPVVAALAEIPWPAVATGIVVLAAGALQFTGWKDRHIARCRAASPACGGTAWRQGLRFGLHCGCGCAGFTAILLAAGVMDPYVMAAVTAATTAERLVPANGRTVRLLGCLTLAAGLLMIAEGIA